jgi:hypothetical protein
VRALRRRRASRVDRVEPLQFSGLVRGVRWARGAGLSSGLTEEPAPLASLRGCSWVTHGSTPSHRGIDPAHKSLFLHWPPGPKLTLVVRTNQVVERTRSSIGSTTAASSPRALICTIDPTAGPGYDLPRCTYGWFAVRFQSERRWLGGVERDSAACLLACVLSCRVVCCRPLRVYIWW